ncbi:VOC family protein [Paenibacillus alkalitolerans]|uniref:VOC family protein n=1 Tax=Paenibacillus alkalitolerans TaxID=2799335 RepID=UPI0018F5E79D|nr:VOC family protein [Paenibacillus alkalitolerans]
MYRVVHFELLSRHPERTAAFYGEVFGWKTVRGTGDYLRLITGCDEDKGINGATVRPLNERLPAQAVNTVQVPDLEQSVATVCEHGGRTLSDIIDLPGTGRFVYCADPEGIPFGMIEYAT